MLAIGNDELENAPQLKDHVVCWICGERHPVEYGREQVGDVWVESMKLGFFRCAGKSYLCGINGKEIRPKEDMDD